MLALVVVLFSAPRAGHGQDPESAPKSAIQPEEISVEDPVLPGWRFELTPYLWLASVSADVETGGSSGDANLDFFDVVDDTDEWGVFGRFEAWYRRFGFYLDGLYVDVESDFDISTPGPDFDADVDIRAALVELGAGFRLLDTGPTESCSLRLAVDVLGGVRYALLKVRAAATGLGPLGITTDLGGTEEWFEPAFGARIQLYVTRRFLIGVRGDVGGFGIGSASELSWKLVAGIGFHITDNVLLKGGYQVFGLDYQHGSGPGAIGFDGEVHGPILGVTFSF